MTSNDPPRRLRARISWLPHAMCSLASGRPRHRLNRNTRPDTREPVLRGSVDQAEYIHAVGGAFRCAGEWTPDHDERACGGRRPGSIRTARLFSARRRAGLDQGGSIRHRSKGSVGCSHHIGLVGRSDVPASSDAALATCGTIPTRRSRRTASGCHVCAGEGANRRQAWAQSVVDTNRLRGTARLWSAASDEAGRASDMWAGWQRGIADGWRDLDLTARNARSCPPCRTPRYRPDATHWLLRHDTDIPSGRSGPPGAAASIAS